MSGRLAAWAVLVGALTAVNYAVRATGGKPPENTVYDYGAAAGAIVLYGIVLGIVLAVARGGPARTLLALRAPASWRLALGLAIGVLIGIEILGVALEPVLHAGREQGLTPSGWDPDRAGAYAANFLVLAVVGPVVEELLFRGAGFSLLTRFGPAVAVGAVGLAFGLVHGLVEGLPILVAFGIGLTYLRSRTGSVYPGILLHVAFNALALVLAVTT